MIAYHYSDKLFKILKPQFAKHSYTSNYSIPILYLYRKKQPEYFIPTNYLYTVKIDKKFLMKEKDFIKLYEKMYEKWNIDKKGYILSPDMLVPLIKKQGYRGIYNDKIIMYFYSIKPIKVSTNITL